MIPRGLRALKGVLRAVAKERGAGDKAVQESIRYQIMGITILVNNSQVKKRLFVSFGQAMPMTDGGCKQTQCTLADRVFVGDGDYWVAGTDVKSAPTGALLDGAAVAGHAVIIERLDVVALREVPDGKQYRRITGAFRRDLGGKAAQFLGRGIMKRPEIGSSIETDDSSNGVSEFRGTAGRVSGA
jgi:hypothetical protein